MTWWNDVIKNALGMLQHADEYAYFYGAKGQTLTRKEMDRLVSYYPAYFSKYTKEELDRIYEYSLGKIGLDCSGFVCRAAGIPQAYSGRLITEATKTMTPKDTPEAGLLYKPGHVGLDIGHGFWLDMHKEGHSVRLGRHSDDPEKWTKGGLLKGVSYDGARTL